MAKEAAFERAMHDIYVQARQQAGHNASYFLQMLEDIGGYATARQLIGSKQPSDGFTALWEKGHLELTVEALVIQPDWRELFTAEELLGAKRRLKQYGFSIPPQWDAEVEEAETIDGIVAELNKRCVGRPIGGLQTLRHSLKALRHRPTSALFTKRSTSTAGEYAFHYGGRTELQFNVGFEERDGERLLRHGVAFSLEPSQTLPDPLDILLPKIARYNAFLRTDRETLSAFKYWRHSKEGWSADVEPREILPEEVAPGAFLFLGRRYDPTELDYSLVLDDWDLLLELYRFVEGDVPRGGVHEEVTEARFTPGHASRTTQPGTRSRVEQALSVTYRHNEIEDALYDALVRRFGKDNVRTEWPCAAGMQVDVAVKTDAGYWFYEVKTAPTARFCIREAIAQLLEYAFWPGRSRAVRLIVVGEATADTDALNYLSHLRAEFDLPIHYECFNMDTGKLLEE